MSIKKLDADRDHIAHIMPDLRVSGCLGMAAAVSRELRRQYQHTLVFETPLTEADPDLYYYAQAYGMDTLQADVITPENLEAGGFTGAILYNVVGHPGLGKVVPSIYYSYGVYDAEPGGTPVACSAYACTHLRREAMTPGILDPQLVIPPLVPTREWRRFRSGRHPFTVGLLTSGAYDKYPCRVAMELLSKLPKDILLFITKLPKYKNPGMQMALDSRIQECRNVRTCPPAQDAALRYLISCDVLIFASEDNHYEPYGRMAVEAMSLGKPVICENRGVFKDTLEHTVNSFLFNTTDEIIDYINRIRKDSSMTELLGANAQMWASWQDTTVHIGKLKRLMRAIGL